MLWRVCVFVVGNPEESLRSPWEEGLSIKLTFEGFRMFQHCYRYRNNVLIDLAICHPPFILANTVIKALELPVVAIEPQNL